MLRKLNFFLLIIEITKMDVSFGNEKLYLRWTVSKVSIYEVFSGSYFPLFGLNTGKYGPEITPYLDIFHAVYYYQIPVLSIIFLFEISKSLHKTYLYVFEHLSTYWSTPKLTAKSITNLSIWRSGTPRNLQYITNNSRPVIRSINASNCGQYPIRWRT